MTDKELLELTAKATGINLIIEDIPDWDNTYGMKTVYRIDGHPCRSWNPLTNDGDAIRLANDLRLVVDCSEQSVWVRKANGELVQDYWGEDYPPCYRHAIVRVAAELGRISYES